MIATPIMSIAYESMKINVLNIGKFFLFLRLYIHDLHRIFECTIKSQKIKLDSYC
jgi:hypothetical protein